MPGSGVVHFASRRYLVGSLVLWSLDAVLFIWLGLSDWSAPGPAIFDLVIAAASVWAAVRSRRLGLWIGDEFASVGCWRRTARLPLEDVASVARLGAGRRPAATLLKMSGPPVRVTGWEGEYPVLTRGAHARFDERIAAANAEIDRRRRS